MSANPDLVVELYDRRNALLKSWRIPCSRNASAEKMKAKLSPDDRARLIDEGKRLNIAEQEKRHEETDKRLTEEALRLPNMSHPDAPVAEGETGNRHGAWGRAPSFSPSSHGTTWTTSSCWSEARRWRDRSSTT